MRKPFRTLLLASLLCLPGVLFARTTAPFANPQQDNNVFAAWTPNQLAPTQSSVDLYIQLPYRGQHNNWSITFSSYEGSYSFSTSSSSNPDNWLYPLGTIPEGTYDVTFVNNDSRDAQFEYWVGCNNAWVQGAGGSHDKTIYSVTVSDGCNNIYIDANY